MTASSRTLRLAALLTLSVAVLAACGGSGPDDSADEAAAPVQGGTPAPSAAPSPAPGPSPAPAPGPSPAPAPGPAPAPSPRPPAPAPAPAPAPGPAPAPAPAPAPVGSATLQWSASSDSRVAGYRVYWGRSSRTYEQARGAGLRANTTSSHVVGNLPAGRTYYFAVTAYDAAGNESDFSAEATKSIP